MAKKRKAKKTKRKRKAKLRLLGDDWLTGMNESGRRVEWPTARSTPQHFADIKDVPQHDYVI
jgi:hypothetical protein